MLVETDHLNAVRLKATAQSFHYEYQKNVSLHTNSSAISVYRRSKNRKIPVKPITYFFFSRTAFSFQNNPNNQDPSKMTHLDFWNCFAKGTSYNRISKIDLDI